MKQDLATSILTAVIGVIVAFFVCKTLLPPIASVSFKTLNSTLTYNLEDPNPEIFNFRAVNPTVEVYVGQCDVYDINGACMDETETTTEEENQQTPQDNSNGGQGNGPTN